VVAASVRVGPVEAGAVFVEGVADPEDQVALFVYSAGQACLVAAFPAVAWVAYPSEVRIAASPAGVVVAGSVQTLAVQTYQNMSLSCYTPLMTIDSRHDILARALDTALKGVDPADELAAMRAHKRARRIAAECLHLQQTMAEIHIRQSR
jgi:hypothetical protein